MQFSIASLIALAAGAHAALFLGNDGLQNFVWIDGMSACGARVINQHGQNPCGFLFTAPNNIRYRLAGCGGNGLTVLNADGSFNSNCRFQVVNNAGCDRKREWVCS